MRESWEQRYQVVEVDGTAKQLTFMQAAARLGVGVFASAALREGALLQDTSLEVHPWNVIPLGDRSGFLKGALD